MRGVRKGGPAERGGLQRSGLTHVPAFARARTLVVIAAVLLPLCWLGFVTAGPASSDSPPPPTVTGVLPDTGALAGGDTVAITGTGFLDGSTTVQFGATAAASMTVNSDTSITAVTPPGTAGSVDVTVTVVGTPNETSATGSDDLFAYGAPTVTSLVPGAGPLTGGNTVNVMGTGFVPGATASFGLLPATDVTVLSGTQLTATAPAGFSVDPIDVTVTTPLSDGGGTSATSPEDLYAYGAPTLASIAPDTGPADTATTVVVTGTNFSSDDTVDFGPTASTDVTILSPTMLTAAAPATLVGAVDITVTNAEGTTAISPLDQFAAGPPTVTAVTPDAGPAGGGGTVTVTGDGFVADTAVTFGGVAAGVTVTGPTTLVATAPVGGTGSVDVVAATAQGASATSTSDLYAYGTAVVASVTPDTGSVGGGDSVTIAGSGFVPGMTVSFGSAPATGVAINATGTSLTATTPAGTGSVDVTITDPDGTSATSTNDLFAYGAPVVTSIAPDAGPVAGGQDVIVAGTGFVPGATVYFGDTVSPSVTVLSGGTGLTAEAPPGTPGPVDITVTTPAGTSQTTLKDAYFYGSPAVTGVSPSSGSTTGGTSVTISGSGFSPDSTVSFGLVPATSVTVTSATSITAVAPAGNLGVIPVRVTTPAGISDITPADNFEYDDQLQISCAPPPSVSTTCDGIELPAVNLQGEWQNSTASANTMYVTDDRGDASQGWSLSAYLMPSPTNPNLWCDGYAGFCNATAGSDSASADAKIPADYFSIEDVDCTPVDGNASPNPLAGTGGEFPNGPGAVGICTASAGSSAGSFKVDATFSLQVPPWIYAGTYEATVEFLVM